MCSAYSVRAGMCMCVCLCVCKTVVEVGTVRHLTDKGTCHQADNLSSISRALMGETESHKLPFGLHRHTVAYNK